LIKVLAITGYKPFELGVFDKNHQGIRYIKKAILKRLVSLVEEGLEWVIISGQLGVELWAAEVVIDMQMEYPDLKLAVITPFLNQEEKWNEANKEQYEAIYFHADYTNSITNKKYESPAQFRLKNRFFIDKSDALLIVYDEEKDGSPKYIYNDAKYKSEQGEYKLFVIDSFDLQAIIEEENFENNGF
jgi:uncharacterized phage-like protein YoqJ